MKGLRLMQEQSRLDSKALPDSVVSQFRKTGSLELTAGQLDISAYKVRKILITAGEWSSPFSEQVEQMKKSGMTIANIAEKLDVSANLVSAYLPYEKVIYNVPDRTLVAGRSDRYRKRIRIAATRADNLRKRSSQADRLEMGENKPEGESAMKRSLASQPADSLSVKTADQPIRLRLVLSDPYLDEDEQRILKLFGESSTGTAISRDVLIPADMTLHALHYAIQRLFGWQNSHLRSFELPDEVFDRLTEGTVKGWIRLIGILFRFTMEEDDRFWDDNYASGSVNTWLKKKYTGPYKFHGNSEQDAYAHKAIQDFIRRHKVVAVHAGFDSPETEAVRKNSNRNAPYKPVILRKAPVEDLTLKELNDSIIMEEGQNSLMERLLVRDILAPKGHPLACKEDLFQSLDSVVPENERPSHSVVPNRPGPVANPPIIPITDTLYYEYDFGDGWRIEITRLDDFADLMKAGRLPASELANAENTVIHDRKPVLIAWDGLRVLDDVGGLSGFVNFLRTIHEDPDMDERISTLDWASSLGWSKRKVTL